VLQNNQTCSEKHLSIGLVSTTLYSVVQKLTNARQNRERHLQGHVYGVVVIMTIRNLLLHLVVKIFRKINVHLVKLVVPSFTHGQWPMTGFLHHPICL